MSGKVNLERWWPHLAAARREDKTLTQYARSRGLLRHTLYAARQMLRCVDGEPGAQRRQRVLRTANELVPKSAFAAMKLPALCAQSGGAAPRLRAQLATEVRPKTIAGL